jgi:VanZ family protein
VIVVSNTVSPIQNQDSIEDQKSIKNQKSKIKNSRVLSLWLPVAAYMALIFYLSSLHEAPLPASVSDKAGHSFGYTWLGVLVTRALAGGLPRRIGVGIALGALAIAIAYGASDELHQHFVAGRSADVLDLYADSAGAAIGVGVCWLWGIIATRKPS